MKYLRYYYFRYIFSLDPGNVWLRHSLKTILVILLAVACAIYQGSAHGLWLVLMSLNLMIMVNINESFKNRLIHILVNWATGLAVLILMIVFAFSIWASLAVLCVLVFMFVYLRNFGLNYYKPGITGLIVAVVATAHPSTFAKLPLILVDFVVALVIVYAVTIFVWPMRLRQQLAKNLHVGLRVLSRYICFILNDASVGYHELNYRMLFYHQLFNLNNLLQNLNIEYKNNYSEDSTERLLKNFNRLVYDAVGIEVALQNLPSRAMVNGPLKELRLYSNAYRHFFIKAYAHDFSAYEEVIKMQEKFDKQMQRSEALIKPEMTVTQHDYKSWYQVRQCIEQFNKNIKSFINIKQGAGQ